MSLHFDIKELTDICRKDMLCKQAALDTLENLGFTWEGGQMWRPPLGKAPYYLRNVPKYITANLDLDILNLVCGAITHDKDYKVLNVDGETYLVKNDLGLEGWYHKSWFYEDDVVAETQDDIEEDSFEDLVYVEPDIPQSEYIVLKLSQLSDQQLKFLSEVFDTDERWYGSVWDIVMIEKGGVDIWKNKLSHITGSKSDLHMFTFNDLFLHKDTLNAN